MKSILLKLSLFLFLTALICILGYYFLYAEILILIRDVLFFAAYICFAVWTSICIYSKVRFGVNTVIFVLSFALAAYMLAYSCITQYEYLQTYCFFAFYVSTAICLLSLVFLVGQFIFRPKNTLNEYSSSDAPKDK
jgi:hypothetical protein